METKTYYKMDLEKAGEVVVAKILPRDWARRLSAKTGKSRSAIYNLAGKLGRVPTEEEILNERPGRPPKFKR